MYYLRSVAPNPRSYQPVKIDRNLDDSAQRMSERSTECGKWRSCQESYVFTVKNQCIYQLVTPKLRSFPRKSIVISALPPATCQTR